jgi:hypothetical protein
MEKIMVKRIAALVFIFVCTSIAWAILGSTILARTYSPLSGELKSRVAASWGTAQQQTPPKANYEHEFIEIVESEKGPKKIKKTEFIPLVLNASKIDVVLDLAHRQKGLLWYSTYAVVFRGDYSFTNPSAQDQDVTFNLSFPSQQAVYDDLALSVDEQPLVAKNAGSGRISIFPKTLFPRQRNGKQPTAGTSRGITRIWFRDMKLEWRCRKSCSRVRWRGKSAILPRYRCSSFSF